MLIKAVALFDQKYRTKLQYFEILFKLLNKLYFIHKIILKKVSQVPKNKMKNMKQCNCFQHGL